MSVFVVVCALLLQSISALQTPTKQQPHVVLHNTALNTHDSPEFHQDKSFDMIAGVPHEFIVQMKLPVEESRAEIESQLNIKFGSYFPHNSYLLYATADVAHSVREHEKVLWMGGFLPQYKIANAIMNEDGEEILQHDFFRFGVQFNGDATSQEFADILRRRITAENPAGLDIVKVSPTERDTLVLIIFGTHGIDHARSVAQYLANMPDIHFIEPIGPTQYYLSAARVDTWSGAKGEDFPTGFENGASLNGEGQIVAIGDNGLDQNAACLAGKSVLPPGSSPADPHGTAMAAAAVGTSGIASGARVTFIALPRGSPLLTPGQKFEAASGQGAYIIASGAGAPADQYNAAAADIDKFLFENPLSLAIFATGNEPHRLTGPGWSKNALVVGGTETGASRHIIGATSFRGSTPDRRFKPDVVASGDNLNLNGCGAAGGGSSMAAAVAAGAAAIARQYFQKGFYPLGTLNDQSDSLGFSPTGALLKAVLIHGTEPVSAARDATGVSGAGDVPSEVQGFGRIQLNNVLYVDGKSDFTLSVVDNEELITGAVYRLCFTVASTKKVKATLTWMDSPADPAAGHVLSNDLDLLIYRASTGQEWRGNNKVSFDHDNNVEQIEFTPDTIDPLPGSANNKYVAIVSSRRLRDAQKFALVMTGGYSESGCVRQEGQNSINEFPQCPNGCSFFENTCQEGTCLCTNVGEGVDCSVIGCEGQDCGPNGTCDFVTGGCRCIDGKRGDSCEFSFADTPPDEIFQTQSTTEFIGMDGGLFAGLAVLLCCIGCVCAILCGAFCGTKFLENRRDAAAAKA